MNNARRRREILVFAVMLSGTTDLVHNTNMKMLYPHLYKFINYLDTATMLWLPNERERLKEIAVAQKLVNDISPSSLVKSNDEWRLWFLLQLVYRLVGSGWKPPTDALGSDFVQALYTVSCNYSIANPPPKSWLTMVAQAPEKLNAAGLFRK